MTGPSPSADGADTPPSSVGENLTLHVQRIGDELLMTLDMDDEDHYTVVSLPIPGGVDRLIEAIQLEAYGEHS